MGSLEALAQNWEAFARGDPLWSICTTRSAEGGTWDEEAFFSSGRARYADLVREPGRHLALPRHRHKALDFGCGVGRFTLAIADDYDQVLGVDIAPSMIALAKRYAAERSAVRYEVNRLDSVRHLGVRSFDLVFSHIVLQHISPDLALGYLRDFCDLIRPGGLVVVQLPHERREARELPATMRVGEVELLGDPPGVWTARERRDVVVRLTNQSSGVWGREHAVLGLGVGNHWTAEAGDRSLFDDGRAYLDGPLDPGESAELVVSCTAPREPGSYWLEVQALQEGVAWFDGAARASSPTSVVEGSLPEGAGPDSGTAHEPVMEMHATPRKDVESAVASTGARVLSIADDDSAGIHWRSSVYYITRESQ